MPRNRERKIQKEKNKGIIDMAAEQFALLLWKQCLWSKKLYKSGFKHKNHEKEDAF